MKFPQNRNNLFFTKSYNERPLKLPKYVKDVFVSRVHCTIYVNVKCVYPILAEGCSFVEQKVREESSRVSLNLMDLLGLGGLGSYLAGEFRKRRDGTTKCRPSVLPCCEH